MFLYKITEYLLFINQTPIHQNKPCNLKNLKPGQSLKLSFFNAWLRLSFYSSKGVRTRIKKVYMD